jgi:hypothetical protein
VRAGEDALVEPQSAEVRRTAAGAGRRRPLPGTLRRAAARDHEENRHNHADRGDAGNPGPRKGAAAAALGARCFGGRDRPSLKHHEQLAGAEEDQIGAGEDRRD